MRHQTTERLLPGRLQLAKGTQVRGIGVWVLLGSRRFCSYNVCYGSSDCMQRTWTCPLAFPNPPGAPTSQVLVDESVMTAGMLSEVAIRNLQVSRACVDEGVSSGLLFQSMFPCS